MSRPKYHAVSLGFLQSLRQHASRDAAHLTPQALISCGASPITLARDPAKAADLGYANLPETDYATMLTGFGLLESIARVPTDSDVQTAKGAFF